MLVDPVEAQQGVYRQGLRELGLKLRFELHTQSEAELSPAANSRYTHLLKTLGASIDLDAGLDGPLDELHWEGVPCVRPLDREGDSLFLEVGLSDVHLTPDAEHPLLLGPKGPVRPLCHRLDIELGALLIRMILLDGARVAWLCRDRLFIPGPLGAQVHDALQALPTETFVYASTPGRWISTLQQELALGTTWPA